MQSFGKTELAHHIAGHTHTKENYNTETGIDALQKSIFDLGVSVAKATKIRWVQLSELVTLIPNIAGATQSPKLAANMVNTKVPSARCLLRRRQRSRCHNHLQWNAS